MNDKPETALVEVAPALPAATSYLEVISRVAADPNCDVDKLERLLAMQERVMQKQAQDDFWDAMSLSQEEMLPISQDASNPQTRSKYASPLALDKAVRPIYTKHGFSVSYGQSDGAPEGHIRITCEISHRGGHTKSIFLDMPNDGKGAKGGDVMTKTHATMSAVTYARRGLLKMAFNIAEGEADDDGNRAGAGPVISEGQRGELISMLDERGKNVQKFCQFMKVQSLADMPASMFDAAKNVLGNTKAEVKTK